MMPSMQRSFWQTVPASQSESCVHASTQRLPVPPIGARSESASHFHMCVSAVAASDSGLDCLVMLRRDRLGHDGEQSVFTREGYPGVRVTELVDPFERLGPEPRNGK